MTLKPVLHGRDHRPGGIDPIPGLTSSVWGFYQPAFSLGSAGAQYATLSGTLAQGTEMFSYSGSPEQAAPLDDGLYAITVSFEVGTNTAPSNTNFIQGVIEKYGAFYQAACNVSPLTNDSPIILPNLSVEIAWYVTTSDYFQIRAEQTGTGTVAGGFNITVVRF